MAVCSRRNCEGDTDKMPNVATDRGYVEFSAEAEHRITSDARG